MDAEKNGGDGQRHLYDFVLLQMEEDNLKRLLMRDHAAQRVLLQLGQRQVSMMGGFIQGGPYERLSYCRIAGGALAGGGFLCWLAVCQPVSKKQCEKEKGLSSS